MRSKIGSHTAAFPVVIPINVFNALMMGGGDGDCQSAVRKQRKVEPAFGSNLRDAIRIVRERGPQ